METSPNVNLPSLKESIAGIRSTYMDKTKLICHDGNNFRFKTPWLQKKEFQMESGNQMIISTRSCPEFEAWWEQTLTEAVNLLNEELTVNKLYELEIYSPDWFPDNEETLYRLEIEIDKVVWYEIGCTEMILKLIHVELKTL